LGRERGYKNSSRDYSNREDGDKGYRNSSRHERPPRAPVAFPTEPPFTAFVGNLQFGVKEDDLFKFFGTNCKVLNVRLLTHRESQKPKGFGYVEFDDLESLKNAVLREGEPLFDRPLHIDVADPKPENKSGGGGGGGGGGG